MKYYTLFDRPPTVPAPSGTKLQPLYERRVKEGVTSLVKTGNQDFYAHIQSQACTNNIYSIIDHVQSTGDLSPLYQHESRFADVSKSPRTLSELLDFRLECRRQFNDLPLSIRELFHNNPDEFMASPSKVAAVIEKLGLQGGAAAQTNPAAPEGNE